MNRSDYLKAKAADSLFSLNCYESFPLEMLYKYFPCDFAGEIKGDEKSKYNPIVDAAFLMTGGERIIAELMLRLEAGHRFLASSAWTGIMRHVAERIFYWIGTLGWNFEEERNMRGFIDVDNWVSDLMEMIELDSSFLDTLHKGCTVTNEVFALWYTLRFAEKYDNEALIPPDKFAQLEVDLLDYYDDKYAGFSNLYEKLLSLSQWFKDYSILSISGAAMDAYPMLPEGYYKPRDYGGVQEYYYTEKDFTIAIERNEQKTPDVLFRKFVTDINRRSDVEETIKIMLSADDEYADQAYAAKDGWRTQLDGWVAKCFYDYIEEFDRFLRPNFPPVQRLLSMIRRPILDGKERQALTYLLRELYEASLVLTDIGRVSVVRVPQMFVSDASRLSLEPSLLDRLTNDGIYRLAYLLFFESIRQQLAKREGIFCICELLKESPTFSSVLDNVQAQCPFQDVVQNIWINTKDVIEDVIRWNAPACKDG